jgi:hypothetical protein
LDRSRVEEFLTRVHAATTEDSPPPGFVFEGESDEQAALGSNGMHNLLTNDSRHA